MRTRAIGYGVALAIVAAGALACGGKDSNPTGPTPTDGGGGGASTTISILGDRGQQSFGPNPATAARGSTVAWRNTDGTTHRIVANDGSFDTGNIAPGASSTALTMGTAGANYHCTIHPGMIGAITAVVGEAPPVCTGMYC